MDAPGEQTYWYKDAIIYELHIKAFADSDGDGIGDFRGLLQKLDYLQDLGVTAIWLLPFYPSPLRDDGYDISDYYSINPAFGDIRTFKRLIREAHKRNLKVITELVINHTSDRHPWFHRARNAPAGSPERDYYVWSDDPNKYKDVRIIFTDTETSNWSWDPVAKTYYWHRFFSHQPDLNFDNMEVQNEIFKILDYWLKMGVDGFRLDAVPYLFEREGTNCENLPETHAFLKKLRKHVDDNFDNKLLLAEANMWPEDSVAYFGDGDECHMNYHFPIMPRMFMSVKMEDRYPITDIIEQTPDIPESCQWAIFLRNHDELTLEMVTDEERDYMYRVYTKEARARINVGIRHRLAPLMENNRNKIELMNVLLFSLPGTPVIYYGDEIGMGDNYYLGDRDGVRTPMQWNADRNAGFSTANPQKLYLPVIIDPEYRYEAINVESQQMNSSSLLWWMKRILAMRKKHKAFSRGTIEFLSPANAKVLSFIRRYEDETILIVANLSRYAQAVELDLEEFEGWTPVEVFSNNEFPRIDDGDYMFTLGSHGYYWFHLTTDPEKDWAEDGTLPKLEMKTFADLTKVSVRENIAGYMLPAYLQRCRWFGGKGRKVISMDLTQVLLLPGKESDLAICTVEVAYGEGLPDLYLLPMAFVDKFDELQELPDKAKIAELTLDEREGMLIDAVYHDAFRTEIFELLQKGKAVKTSGGQLDFTRRSRKSVETDGPPSGRMLNAEQSNTSIIYGSDYFLKLYRKLDASMNPDVEITRYLTEKTSFTHSPAFLGAMEIVGRGGGSMIFGMVQELVANQGDAFEHTKDMLRRYYDRAMSRRESDGTLPKIAALTEPLHIGELNDSTRDLFGVHAPEIVALLGRRTAEMHMALAADTKNPDFTPESFSLHYQRSLYSGLQSLTRSTFDTLRKNKTRLPEAFGDRVQNLLGQRSAILQRFKKIFDHKITSTKIRNHGDYHLGQVLWTGEDFIIIDFEGEPARSFSERRLKRSPVRDVAGMLRSFHYAAQGVALENFGNSPQYEAEKWAELWYNVTGRIFLHSYLEQIQGSGLVPENEGDFHILLDTFLLEKAVYELNYEINNRPDWVIIPIKGIETILNDNHGQ